ncbi:hypothetical protein N7486_005127 [Penicillium sp. IBT 16267x]|nr:hypothetical protein N7486_005127 [Penicillium sp. IBT 16267x]
MGEIFLDKALGFLSSDKQKDRAEGLADLKHILQQNKQSSKLLDLSDKACQKIFESLFRFVALERSIYNRAQRSNSKSPSSTRLSTCASVLRAAVDTFLRNLRAKTVRAIIDHITETIPIPGEDLWEPLSVDYTKCLASLLRHSPHTEHLGDAEWGKLMDFCLAAINVEDGNENKLSTRSGYRSAPEEALDGSDSRSSSFRMTPTPTLREKTMGDRNNIGEILVCIQLLTASPSAPVQAAAENILQSLVELVKSPAKMVGNAHQLAFSSIKTIISKVFFDQSDLVRSSLLTLIPVIRRLWTTKFRSLKDELLATLMLCMAILVDLAAKDPTESLMRLVERLTDSLHSEYVKRPEKDQLQIDEIVFYHTMADSSASIYGPRFGNTRSEHNWTILWVIANLFKISETLAGQLPDSKSDHETSHKRQRVDSVMEDIVRDATSATGTRRICALQLIPFLEKDMDVERKEAITQRLVPCILDDSATVSSWTMLALTSIAKGSDARLPVFRAHWSRAIDLTTRSFSSSGTSRAACKFTSSILEADLLDYSIATETVRSLLSSANYNGPSAISDSSLELWSLITRRKTQLNPGSIQNSSKQICNWLREVWTIGAVTDRIQTANVAMFARPLDLLNLFLACTNRSFDFPCLPQTGISGNIAKTWFFFHENRGILEYLSNVGGSFGSWRPWDRKTTWSLKLQTRAEPDDEAILELLRSKSESILQMWKTLTEDKSYHVTADLLQIAVSFCLVSGLYAACLPPQLAPKTQEARQNCQILWCGICDFLATRGSNFMHMQACLEVLSPILPSVSILDSQSVVWAGLYPLVAPLANILENLRQNQKEHRFASKDLMDLDDQLTPNGEEKSADQIILSLNRESTPLFSDTISFQRCLTIQLSLLLRLQPARPYHEPSEYSSLNEYLASLDEADLLSARHVIPEAYHGCSEMDRDGILRVIEDTGETCLQSYEMERCEASHSVCIRMMTGLVACWTGSQSDTLNDSAMDLYNWFMEALLARKRASPRVYIILSELIQAVLDICPSYGSEQSLPSPRTSLFTILHEGDAQVKFSVANFVPTLFERFLFKDHDAIFDDVLESLPRDPDWIEGIALRLFVLCLLASGWHTLLRRSIYHMFETPAQVPLSLEYARKCLKSVSKARGLEDGRQLFRLFASQILYTWTETQPITSMPFSIFGYGSLKEMVADVKEELVGQMMMRAKESETQELAALLEEPHLKLLETSFHKAEAYSVARDISTPPEQGSQPKGMEIRLRKLLGAPGFLSQVESQFPQIIANLFKALDRYDQIERAYSKRPAFRYALDIQNRMASRCNPQSSLPANQQPSFRARYLLDELEFICNRAGFELESIWTPTLVSFVCRSLLESIHPALGSLHTCSVIRKIRILVCLAGPIILEDYPFEMLLHALRPFLIDVHCCEDVLGILWYLFDAGKAYLTRAPGFMAGICISTLVTLRKLFASSPESTTQESQFRTVLANAHLFHQWLCDLINDYDCSDWSADGQKSFSQLLSLAQQFSVVSDSPNGQHEKHLVFEVLKDRDSAQPLLSKSIGDNLLSLLCPEIKRPLDKEDLNLDSTCHVVSLWDTLDRFDSGPEYSLWAARLIGRSFAATGKIDKSLLREQELSFFKASDINEQLDSLCQSKASILHILCEKLPTHNHVEAGLIERTLQLILNKIAQFPDFQGCAEVIPESLMKALIWNPYSCPDITLSGPELEICTKADASVSGRSVVDWARDTSLLLCNVSLNDPVVGSLRKVLNVIPQLAVQLLPYIVHDVLLAEDRRGQIRQDISENFKQILREVHGATMPHARSVINCILYLRNQPVPDESTIVERDMWLDVDFGEASSAAHQCGLQKTALLFLEIQASRVVAGSRRSSVVKYEPPLELLHDIFKNVDDPDLFYGIQQSSSLTTVMERLEYESSGLKNLLFQSAQYDSEIQVSEVANPSGVLKALNAANLQGVANTMLFAGGGSKNMPLPTENMLQGATSLQQWDVPVSPLDSSPSATVFRAFQSLNTSSSLPEIFDCIDECLLTSLNSLTDIGRSAIQIRDTMRALGILTEMSDVIQSSSCEEMKNEWKCMQESTSWLKTESYHEVGEILGWHEALFSSIRKSDLLKSRTKMKIAESRLLEANVFRQSLEITRKHAVSQASLKSAISLSRLAEPCAQLGLNIDGATKFDLANVLWDQGEMTASIRMLQHLKGQGDLQKQAIPLSRSELLVTLGHHVAEARLEKPDSILQDYLSPAVKELKGESAGETAGRVYHGFAAFCDQQLLNADGLEDFKRVEQLRNRKEKELRGLEDMMKNAEGREKDSLKIFRSKAKQWFDLDDREYQRLLGSREAFLQQCLENYLLALQESDAYHNDILRFCALWLDKSDSKIANLAVSKHLHEVPSYKFAPLMNQLSSRLLDVSDDFQALLDGLVYKICVEHPFHGMYQIFASSKSKGGKDPSSHSRFRAANQLVDRLKNDSKIGPTWVAVHNMNITYVRFAVDKPDPKFKTGAKISLKKLSTGERLGQDARTYKLPPPTMKIELRRDRDYSKVPTVAKFSSEFTLASGVSAPKVVTAIATDGVHYKQLYKGGNDDLRQDAIMEQVFEQVSSVLNDHQPTRQRNLGIRTYKVLPLTLHAGIIEFVPNTIPLHDYLMPAHQRYFPKDMKPSACRKHIADVQNRSFEQRVRTYRQVTEHFHPVMKYFFMEKFNNPDDWFSKRLAYTRSTAAISILGHVLGLGDRHGHNILLDEKTGEVVHIDLGVAFEQGRILPVPEVVPFRLTRDLVDGFGITKTEGVFRRCCEFTLEALRQESYSIMTILDVLRYDPLYSWTVSPLRMKKMQDNQEVGDGLPVVPGTTDQSSTNEPSEAERALTVVAKKLSKTLSVTATVNELIQQATDERNLAMLYCVSASIAGPTAAYWFARAGANVTVIERFPSLRTNGHNIDIRVAGVTVMRKIPGMEAAVRAKKADIEGISFVDSEGRAYGTIRSTGNPDKRSLISEYEIARGDLSHILYDMTKDNENINYVFGEQVASIQQGPSEDGPVIVEFTGSLPTSEFDLVVACDGATSRTRSIGLICGSRDHIVSTNSCISFFSPGQDLGQRSKIEEAHSAVGGRFMAVGADAAGGTRISFMGCNPRSDMESILPFRKAMKEGEDAVKKYICQHYQDVGWKANEALKCMLMSDDLYATELVQVKLPSLFKGGFVLVGDAGYAPGPTGTGTTSPWSVPIC